MHLGCSPECPREASQLPRDTLSTRASGLRRPPSAHWGLLPPPCEQPTTSKSSPPGHILPYPPSRNCCCPLTLSHLRSPEGPVPHLGLCVSRVLKCCVDFTISSKSLYNPWQAECLLLIPPWLVGMGEATDRSPVKDTHYLPYWHRGTSSTSMHSS